MEFVPVQIVLFWNFPELFSCRLDFGTSLDSCGPVLEGETGSVSLALPPPALSG